MCVGSESLSFVNLVDVGLKLQNRINLIWFVEFGSDFIWSICNLVWF